MIYTHLLSLSNSFRASHEERIFPMAVGCVPKHPLSTPRVIRAPPANFSGYAKELARTALIIQTFRCCAKLPSCHPTYDHSRRYLVESSTSQPAVTSFPALDHGRCSRQCLPQLLQSLPNEKALRQQRTRTTGGSEKTCKAETSGIGSGQRSKAF